MANHGTATINQFAEFSAIVTRSLPRAIEGLDVSDLLRRTNGNGEQLSHALRTAFETLGITADKTADQPAEPPASPPAPEPLPDVILLTLGDRSYRVPRIIADGESVNWATVLGLAEAKKATSGQDDCEWFLSHQEEINAQIPIERRGEVVFVFINWIDLVDSVYVAVVFWSGGPWVQVWRWLGEGWGGPSRPIERSA